MSDPAHPPPWLRILAESSRYVLGHEYEQVFVFEKQSGVLHEAGDHYGDPECGLIDPDEQWFLAGGEGLTFYTPRNGVVGLLRGKIVPRPLRSRADTYFVRSMRIEQEHTVRVLVDPWSDKASVWRFFPDENRLEKLRDGPDLRSEPWCLEVEY